MKQSLGSGSIAKTTTVCFSISPEELTEQRDSKTKYLQTTFIPNEVKRYSPDSKIQAVGYNPVYGGKEEKQRIFCVTEDQQTPEEPRGIQWIPQRADEGGEADTGAWRPAGSELRHPQWWEGLGMWGTPVT